MKKISYCVIVLAAVISGARSRASGAIFSNFELSQDVEAVLSGPGLSQSVTQTVSGQGAPQHQVVTLNPGYGGTITATYDVYDNGTTAGFSIQTSAATTAANNTLYEGDDAFPHTNFTLGQAVSYTLSIYSTAYSTADLGLDLATLLPGQGYGDFSPIPGQQYRFSGMFSAGQECVLEEGLALSNLSPGLPADMSGDDSIVMTFTAVPEPSSAILLPGLAIAARRRPGRRRKS